MKFRIRRLRLKNWKNFTEVDIPIEDRVFLVGPNASGKSNFLDVLRFLRDLVSPGGGFEHAVNLRGGISVIRSLAARRDPAVEIDISLAADRDEWQYLIAFSSEKNRKAPVIEKEYVRRNQEILLDRPDEHDKNDPLRLTQTALEQINVNRPFRELADFFGSIRYLHLVPQLIREPNRFALAYDDPYGSDFLYQIAKTPERTRARRFALILSALRAVIPQLKEIELRRDERGNPHLDGKFEHWRPNGAWQNETCLSDGTIRLIGLLWIAMEKGGPLLLEEPEASLHPAIVRVLPQTFARILRQSGRQVFVSTHSPDLLQDEGISPREVLLLNPSKEGTRVTPTNQDNLIRAVLEGGLSLADIVISASGPDHPEQLHLFQSS
ncbi:MAG TPA: AAA family ATPase [Candidatus Hydrogenedentes bacterium]|nr:AAA family ATPase [Candidatus Hydrogenedentota bacterium]